jgi:DNA polymerase III subunit gamma/tau
MSYLVIARKWRPQAFDEVTGQEHITRTLRNALEYDRLHHAYLFSGARGVGKTTTARLLAKALNCHRTEGPGIAPCRAEDPEACPSCVEIAESRSMDVLEIDAASHTGVGEIRDTILEGINIRAARDRFKVFIIDEVHMLSRNAFNALLKTLEEPPASVVFIMATTELHKVPETILSRCQEFAFRTIPLQKIFDRLKLIADAELINVSDEALREIARSGEGSMRDAQSNFDQVISFSGDVIGVDDVSAALGMAGSEMLSRSLAAIADGQPRQILQVVADLISRGHDLRNYTRDLLSVVRDLLVYKVAGDSGSFHETSVLDDAEMASVSKAFSGSDLVRIFHSLAETETALKDAAQPRYVLEVGLVKLVEMRRMADIASIVERLAALEASLKDQGRVPAAQAQPSPLEEKKTLVSQRAVENRDDLDRKREAAPVPTPAAAARNEKSLPFAIDLSSVRMALPQIDPERLEHFDDTYLDRAFDEALLRSGESLGLLPNAAEMARLAAGTFAAETAVATAASVGQGPSRFAPPAIPSSEVPPSPHHVPPPPENATEDELKAYAEAYPLVRNALRLFRGEIVSVNRS